MTDAVTYFDNAQNAMLSNFYQGRPLRIGTRTYATGEHAFQAYKATSLVAHNQVRLADTPNEAKHRGRRVALRSDWEAIKYDVMRLVLSVKFTEAREEGQFLLSTGDALLVEGTHWGDQVWGVDLNKKARRQGSMGYYRPGRNWLGALLMARRAELRAGVDLSGPNSVQCFNYFSVQSFVNKGVNT